jgi:hypothetical protein
MTPEEVIEELGIGRESSKPESRKRALAEFADRNNFPDPVPMGNGKFGYLIDDIKDWARKDGKRLLKKKREEVEDRGAKGAAFISTMRKLQKEEGQLLDEEPEPKPRSTRERLGD